MWTDKHLLKIYLSPNFSTYTWRNSKRCKPDLCGFKKLLNRRCVVYYHSFNMKCEERSLKWTSVLSPAAWADGCQKAVFFCGPEKTEWFVMQNVPGLQDKKHSLLKGSVAFKFELAVLSIWTCCFVNVDFWCKYLHWLCSCLFRGDQNHWNSGGKAKPHYSYLIQSPAYAAWYQWGNSSPVKSCCNGTCLCLIMCCLFNRKSWK